MNLYLISQDLNLDYYEHVYDTSIITSAVVVAESEDDARSIQPGPKYEWCDIEHVKVECIGTASDSMKRGVVCVSYTISEDMQV